MKRTKTSKAWMQEHLNDPYVQQAQRERYRSRACYKLLELHDKDRLIRPVAHEGHAEAGFPITIEAVEPGPTLAVDGAWWHPVAVTNPHLKIADSPLPLAEVFDVVRDVVAVQETAHAEGRTVFRCT